MLGLAGEVAVSAFIRAPLGEERLCLDRSRQPVDIPCTHSAPLLALLFVLRKAKLLLRDPLKVACLLPKGFNGVNYVVTKCSSG